MPFSSLDNLVQKALSKGADHAEAMVIEDKSMDISVRLQNIESVEESVSKDLGLRVIVGSKQAIVSSSHIADDTFDSLVDRALDMARVSMEDPYCVIADSDNLIKEIPAIESFDDNTMSSEQLKQRALEAEQAALDINGITNSDGADAGQGVFSYALVSSNGFKGQYRQSYFSNSVSVLAGKDTEMERDYDYAVKVFCADLPAPSEIGKAAAENTLRRLNPVKGKTGTLPVVFDPRVGVTLLRAFARSINGRSVARKSSFLQDKLGEQLFSKNIQIIDDPRMVKGLASRPFDAEGLAAERLDLVEDGKLQTWIMDLASAKQLGLESSGRASRSTSSPPSPTTTNLYIAAGEASVDELIHDIKEGFYVTETMGMGVNTVTGEYSQGASGFWIENGKIAFPVNEISIGGQMLDMMINMQPANDLEFKYSTNVPTLRIDDMTVAGS